MRKEKIIKIIFIIILSFTTASYFRHFILKAKNNRSQNKIVLEQISNIVYYGILIFGIGLILIEFGVQKTTIYALLISTGFTIGISLQSILSRCLSGIYIIMLNLYDIGDTVKVAKITGTVKSFNLFYTLIYNETDKVEILVPNESISSSELINYSRL